MVEKIVREQAAVFGGLPPFDGGTYTFLMDYLPWADGDGMEHRNSTVCTVAGQPGRRHVAGRPEPPRTSSSMRGTSSVSGQPAWSRSTSPRRTCRVSCGWPRASPATTGVLAMIRAGLVAEDQGAAQLAMFAAGGAAGARHAVPIGRGHEPARTVRRRGQGHRPDQLGKHVRLVLHVRGGARPRTGPDAARAERRVGDAGRLHAAAVEDAWRAGWAGARLREPPVYAGRRANGTGCRQR